MECRLITQSRLISPQVKTAECGAGLNLTSVYIGVTSCLPPRKWNIRSIQLTINVIKHQGGVRCPAWLYVTVACETYYYLSNSSYFNIQKIDRNFLIRLGYALLDDG